MTWPGTPASRRSFCFWEGRDQGLILTIGFLRWLEAFPFRGSRKMFRAIAGLCCIVDPRSLTVRGGTFLVASKVNGARIQDEESVCFGSWKGSHRGVQPVVLVASQARSDKSALVRSRSARLPCH